MKISKFGKKLATTSGITHLMADPDAFAHAVGDYDTAQGNTAIAADPVRTGKILTISRDMIKPYYLRKAEKTVDLLCEELKAVDFCIHKPERAFFL